MKDLTRIEEQGCDCVYDRMRVRWSFTFHGLCSLLQRSFVSHGQQHTCMFGAVTINTECLRVLDQWRNVEFYFLFFKQFYLILCSSLVCFNLVTW